VSAPHSGPTGLGFDDYHSVIWGVAWSGYVYTMDISSGTVGNVTSLGGGQYDIFRHGVGVGIANVVWETDCKNNVMRRMTLF
jgi:hypothetical protein